MTTTHPEVDAYLRNLDKWQQELVHLRKIVHGCPLVEAWKWRIPVYTFQNKNVAAISALKECCVLSFFQGVLLKDPEGILAKPGENSRAARVIRFTHIEQIAEHEATLHAYLLDAIELEKSGQKVDLSADAEVPVPTEFQDALDQHPALRAAFEALTPGRRRGYLLHFAGAKQSKTRADRIEKCTPRILDGKGLHDCTCGHTKKPPQCDGSHKFL